MSTPVKLRPAPLWRPRFTPEFFEEMERSPRAAVQTSYNRGYRLRAVNDSDLLFPNFEHCRQRGLVLGELIRNVWPIFTGVDLSGKKRKGNAIVSVAVDPYSKVRYVVDVRAGAWKASETAEQIGIVYDLLRPKIIMVEDNGYQDALINIIQMAKMSFWPIVEPTTTTGYTKHSTEIGLSTMDVQFKNRAWVIPWSEYEGATPDDPGVRGMWATFDSQFRHYPFSSQSDYIMATWFAHQAIERNLHFHIDAGAGSVGNLNVR